VVGRRRQKVGFILVLRSGRCGPKDGYQIPVWTDSAVCDG
jgi:hypothetical protein